MESQQLTLGIGTRLQHTQFGPGVVVGVRYATYLISFINHGVKEIDKTDTNLDEIIPENITTNVLYGISTSFNFNVGSNTMTFLPL